MEGFPLRVDEAQLMSTEELPPENDGEASASDDNRQGGLEQAPAGAVSMNCNSSPPSCGPLGVAHHTPTSSIVSTPQTQASSLQPLQAWQSPVLSTPQSTRVALRPAAQTPNVLMVNDRKVRVNDGEDPSCYALCRRWIQNDPDGVAHPSTIERMLQSGVLAMTPYNGDISSSQSTPHFWEMSPISLLDNLNILPDDDEIVPPPTLQIPEHVSRGGEKHSIEELRKQHMEHWLTVRAHFKKKGADRIRRSRSRFAHLLAEAKKVKGRVDALDHAREEARALEKQRAEAQARLEEEARIKAQEKQALTGGAGALPLGTIAVLPPVPVASPPQQVTPARAPILPMPGSSIQSPRSVTSRPPLYPTTPNVPRPTCVDPATPVSSQEMPASVSTPVVTKVFPSHHPPLPAPGQVYSTTVQPSLENSGQQYSSPGPLVHAGTHTHIISSVPDVAVPQ
eukprot:jgi/Botrbrau1/19331/Bobra.0073s0061.1